MASNNNNNVSIWEEWSSDSGEPVDLQLTGALLCVGRLLDRHNLVARGCMRACVRACVLRGTEDHVPQNLEEGYEPS